ncbi:leucine--tRNA ligase [Geranomyces variabilis]|nr:leucine--tRNA ligase [Geranomyces variabilis]
MQTRLSLSILHRHLGHRPLRPSLNCQNACARRQSTAPASPSSSSVLYDPVAIERKWLNTPFLTPRPGTNGKMNRKFYVLCMFPYPSGTLHMGHVRVYTIADVIARYNHMQGFSVMHPMGWDSFGLPAENAAIDHGVHPREWTISNIAKMKAQMQSMGTAFDWTRELATSDPTYYRWTQALFLELYKKGLVYQKEAVVNWDPVDNTVLANEQVDVNGRAERSGALVEKRFLKQWFIRITAYAEELLRDLKHLDWPENVKTLQRNWIGKTTGLETDVTVTGITGPLASLSVFAPAAGGIKNATYIAVGVGHPLLSSTALRKPWLDEVTSLSTKLWDPAVSKVADVEGTFTGLTAKHPSTGRELPIYLAGYAELPGVAYFGAPKCSAPDRKFAEQHGIATEPTVLSGKGRPAPVRFKTHYRLRDWLISRQRYWGTPIPMIHCKSCGPVPMAADQLPSSFPPQVEITARGHPLASASEWARAPCPKCGDAEAQRDSDTMDTFVDSAWYWLRYCDPQNSTAVVDPKVASRVLPVDIYVGGVEHSIMHLLYARFFGKFLHKQGIVSLPHEEPFTKLLTQGMVQGRTVRDPETERYLRPSEVDLSSGTAIVKATGASALVSWEKMSKSKYNGVDPSEIIKKHGSDAMRLYILYKAAPADELAWEDSAIIGMERFLGRVWRIAQEVGMSGTVAGNSSRHGVSVEEKELKVSMHTAVQEVTETLTTTYALNVAIASLIKLTHAIDQCRSVPHAAASPMVANAASVLVRMLAPFAPCIAQEVWQLPAFSASGANVFASAWPIADASVVESAGVVCAVMINGKTRGTMTVPVAALEDEATLQALALESDAGRKWLVDARGAPRTVVKCFVAKQGKAGKGRVVSFVVES